MGELGNYPVSTATVHGMFEAQVRRTPDAIALIFENEVLTFSELDQRANQLARWLITQGVNVENRVGLMLERSMEMMIAILGVFKAGAAYLPIDPDTPEQRVAFMMQEAAADLILTQERFVQRIPGKLVHFSLDSRVHEIQDLPLTSPEIVVHPDNLAYVMFTSGSTGEPKGVMVEHRNICNGVFWKIQTFPPKPDDRVLQKSTYTFDACIWEFFYPLFTGTTLVLASPGGHKDPRYLISTIIEMKITMLHIVSSMLQLLLAEAEIRQCVSLRRVLCAGEAMSPELQARCFAVLPHIELHNLYGTTETSVISCDWLCTLDDDRENIPIGFAVANNLLYVLDDTMRPVGEGEIGELYIGGSQVSRGYLNRPELTSERFVPDPFAGKGRMYRTGDLVRCGDAGEMYYQGRNDFQVKIRGQRVELGEIEACLERHPRIRQCVVMAREDRENDQRLVAYVTWRDRKIMDLSALRAHIQISLPEYMVPQRFVFLEEFPLNQSGKVDRQALDQPSRERPQLAHAYQAAEGADEKRIAELWSEHLGIEMVGVHDRFFELGGSSLNAVEFVAHFETELGERIPIVRFFEAPTIREFNVCLWREHYAAMSNRFPDLSELRHIEEAEEVAVYASGPLEHEPLAVIGMAGRFPGAADIDELWQNLLDGVEAVRFASDEELFAAGVNEDDLINPDYVRAYFSLEDPEYFDAAFFGYQPQEAALMDPQHRLFLELAWLALDNAGYSNPDKLTQRVGVFGGLARDSYSQEVIAQHPDYRDHQSDFSVMIGNDKNFPVSRASYKLGLKGPAIDVQTACSTSGVALHLAGQSLNAGECDMALVGGCRVMVPIRRGYEYVEDGALSADGHLYAFDERGSGMVRGSGGSMLLLKRLSAALNDGDVIRAVIKGSAINNDGNEKIGFTAPSIKGQQEVIIAALQKANVSADSIQYVETHGTATALGDPIEIAGLSAAYKAMGANNSLEPGEKCLVGSIKTNLGHLDAGAAASGIVKTVLALENKIIPASLNYANANQNIDFSDSPLSVCASNTPWPKTDGPRRAAVSSFGLGGTNFHCILEESPTLESDTNVNQSPWQMLTLSAKNLTSLNLNIAQCKQHLLGRSGVPLASFAFSLNTGREAFNERALLWCRHGADDTVDFDLKRRDQALRNSKSFWFLLQDNISLEVELWREFYLHHPVFAQGINSCRMAILELTQKDYLWSIYPLKGNDPSTEPCDSEDGSDALLLSFATQFAFYRLLLDLALPVEGIVCDGISALAAGACLSGSCSLEIALAHTLGLHSGSSRQGELESEQRHFTTPGIPLYEFTRETVLQASDLEDGKIWNTAAGGNSIGTPSILTRESTEVISMSAKWTMNSETNIHIVCAADHRFTELENQVLDLLGQWWLQGIDIKWRNWYFQRSIKKIPLPAYQFDRKRFWIEKPQSWPQVFLFSGTNEVDIERKLAYWSKTTRDNPSALLHHTGELVTAANSVDKYRAHVVASMPSKAQLKLTAVPPVKADRSVRSIVFMFPGGGTQYLNMAMGLYQRSLVFRDSVDEGLALFGAGTGINLRRSWFPRPDELDVARKEMLRPSIQLPTIFILEVALTRLWIRCGFKPDALIGHSLGENTAAHISGVLTYKDALGLVALRGRLFEGVEKGGMVSIALPADSVDDYLGEELDLATINGPEHCTVSGKRDAIDDLIERLEKEEISWQEVPIDIAAHSRWLDPILAEFETYLRSIKLESPQIPFVSNLTGDWITDDQARDADYWVQHLRNTVRFGDGVSKLLAEDNRVYLEIGPGKVLGSLVKAQAPALADYVMPSLRHAEEETEDLSFWLESIARLWELGAEPDWVAVEHEVGKRIYVLPPAPVSSQEVPMQTVLSGQELLQTSAAQAVKKLAVPATVQDSRSRLERILEALQNIIYEMSGKRPEEVDVNGNFVGMGFDSLFLTGFNLQIKKTFSVKLKLRQVIRDTPTLKTLSEHLDGLLAPDVFAAQPTAPVSSQNVDPVPQTEGLLSIDSGGLQQTIIAQLQANNALIASLQGTGQSVLPAQPRTGEVKTAPLELTQIPTLVDRAEVAEVAEKVVVDHGPFRPIQVKLDGELNNQQNSYLEGFVERYVKQTQKSKALAEEHRPHYADPRTVMGFKSQWKDLTYTLVAERSKGSHVWDIDGNEYVDCMGGFGAIFFGHAPDFVLEALRLQLDSTLDYGPQSKVAGEVARMLCEVTGMDRASFCNTGSEAALAAIRIARTVTGNDLIVMFAGSYHGIFDEVLVNVKQIGNERRNVAIAPGIPASASDHVLVLDYDDPASLDIIRERSGELAAVIVEPIQSRRPELLPTEFLHKLREITATADVALIFDEIITGFRIHPRGAQGWFGVDADIVCYGKVIGGGMPVGVVAGKSEYMDALDGGMWEFGDDSFPEVGVTYFAGTFIRHPLAIAAVRAVLTHLQEFGPELQAGVSRRTAIFAERVNQQYRMRGIPVELTYFASAFVVRFHGDSNFESLFSHHLRFFGAHHIWGTRPAFMTTEHSDKDFEFLVNAFIKAGEALQDGGFLPLLEDQQVEFYPFTSLQIEMWLAVQQGDDASAAYNEQVMFELDVPIDPLILELAVDKTINRHQSLRAVVSDDEQGLVVKPYMPVEIHIRELTGTPTSPEQSTEIRQAAQRNIDQPFDFKKGPLIRVLLINKTASENVLCVCVSHLVCDGFSLEKVMEDIAGYYTGIVESKYVERPDEPPLADLVNALESKIATAEYEEAGQYWKSQYSADLPPPLDLPADFPRPHIRSFKGERQHFYFESELIKPLRELAQSRGVTTFVLMLSVFQLLMNRLTGETDLVIGIPAAGQPNLGMTDLVAHCVSFLPLRTRLDLDRPFSEGMLALRNEFLDAKENQDFAYGDLLQELRMPRDPGRLPLVSTSFNMDLAYNPLDFCGTRARFVATPRGHVKYDLLFNLTDEGDRVLLEVDYYVAMFTSERVQGWVASYERMLRDLLEDPDQPGRHLVGISTAQKSQLESWNQTEVDFGIESATLHGMFESQVEKSPEAIALVFEDKQISFAELNRRANRLSNYLCAHEVKPDQCMMIVMDRSIELVVAMLGVLKAGAAYLPIDVDIPRARLNFIVGASKANMILTQNHLTADLHEGDGVEVVVCDDDAFSDFDSSSPPDVCVDSRNLAYVIYTSGSTGEPKGVVIEHQAICNRLLWKIARFPPLPEEKVLQKTPYTFDVSLWEFFYPLVTGARMILASPEGHKDSRYLINLISSHEVTTVHFVPSMLHVFLEDDHTGDCKSLKRVLCSGESLSVELQGRFFSVMPWAELHNLYGPTEAAVDVTHWECKAEHPGTTIPIGRPIANTRMYIFDETMSPIPIGRVGELFIGGVQLARGYLNRPDLTAERFIEGPPGCGRLYRSGDLARFLDNGAIEFLGRNDFQVKIRGQRIELAEIEAVLERHPEITQCVVMAREDRVNDQRLVAYMTSKEATGPTVAELRNHARQELPDYMVPQHFEFLDELPKTTSGKVDRDALPVPAGIIDKPGSRKPSSKLEKEIHAIWCEILEVSQISIDADFFEVGGHSLLGTVMFAKIETKLGVRLSLQVLFQYPTILQLAEVIAIEQAEDSGKSIVQILPNIDAKNIPASSQQMRLWYLQEINPFENAFNLPAGFRLKGDLDAGALHSAAVAILNRHDALRSNLVMSGEQLLLTSRADVESQISVSDTQIDFDILMQELRVDAAKAFDLGSDPLFYIKVYRIGAKEHLLYINCHHVVFDGWSYDILLRELCILYNAFKEGESNPLPALPIQYADYAIWQRDWLKTESVAEDLQYWRELLEGDLPVLELPTDKQRPSGHPEDVHSVLFSLDEESLSNIEAFASRCGCTLYMLMMGAFGLLLHRYSRQRDILIGSPISGRNHEEISGLLGYFVNTLTYRLRFDSKLTLADWLQEVKATCLQAYDHQDVMFESLIPYLRLDRDRSRSPVFQAFMIYQDTRNRTQEFEGLSKTQVIVDRSGVQTDIDMWVKRERDGLVGGFDYPGELFDAASAENMRDWLVRFVTSMSDNAETTIGDLALADATESTMISKWNDTTVTVGAHSFPQVFSNIAIQDPDKAAVTSAADSLTYGELEAASNRCASYLQALGVAKGQLVGVCLDRTERMLVVLLAIMKAGGAYVPLDPDYPSARLRYMIDTAKLDLIVTESAFTDVLALQECRLVVIDEEVTANAIADAVDDSLECCCEPSDPVYVIFTSGSTGNPKGVKVTHGCLANFLSSMSGRPGLSENNILLAVTTLSFDIAALELFLPLFNGASIVLASVEDSGDGKQLRRLIEEYNIDVMQATPGTWRMLLASDWKGSLEFKALVGGEAFPSDLHEPLVAGCKEVWNMYGPTETTIWSTCHKVEAQDSVALIGSPIGNTTCIIVDEELHQVPIGAAGELCIGGEGVSAGYIGDPAQEAKSFITMEGQRMYRTGDLARWRASGKLQHLNRIDNQVKVRGFRIELGEIETRLNDYSGIEQAVAVVREDQPGDQRLVAYYVSNSGEKLQATSTEIRDFLRGSLPDYMIPQYVVPLDSIPLTLNGKIDRKALPVPYRVGTFQVREEPTSTTATEEMIAGIWRELLGIEEVKGEDNFFDLGGHSMLSLQFVSRVKKLCGVEIPPRETILNDLRQLAAYVDSSAAGEAGLEEELGGNIVQALVAKPLAKIKRLFGRSS